MLAALRQLPLDQQNNYTPLRDLRPSGAKEKANLYGLVVAFKMPKKTKKDFMLTCELTDASLVGQPPVKVHLYSEKADTLPPLQLGCIMRVHRATVDVYMGRPEVQVTRFRSSWCLFAPQTHEVLASSSPHPSTYPREADCLKQLEAACSATGSHAPNMGYCRSVAEVLSGQTATTNFDVIGMVVDIVSAPHYPTPDAFFQIILWDGSTGGGPPDHWTAATHADAMEGHVIQVKGGGLVCRAGTPRGCWLKFRNVSIADASTGICRAGDMSGVELLSEKHARVQELLKEFKEKRAALAGQNTAPCTANKHQDQPVRTLREVLTDEPPQKHRCKARLVNFHPRELANCAVPVCPEGHPLPHQPADYCAECQKSISECKFTFVLQLKLEDDTASLNALLVGSRCEEFLSQPCVSLVDNGEARTQVERRLVGALRRTLDCNVLSYTQPSHPGPIFQLFDTVLL
mmetsp:Transcript_1079/g.2592  ORF Transcript_1079/g.2592 Transcript_1079/m.2592 type:complete len:460 (+) Transcript_1079:294-1673(+)